MYDVCALGELLIDFTPSGVNDQGVTLFGRNPGGAPANMLALLCKLGGKGAFIGKVGDDDFGHFLQQALTNAGIDCSGLVLDPTYLTTISFVQLSDSGDRSCSFYRRQGADLMLTWPEIKRKLIDEAHVFHFGSVSLSDEPCRGTVAEAVSYAKSKNKIISYDPNYRPFLWPSEAEAKAEIGKFIDSADILKVAEEEMALLTGTTDLAKGSAMLASRGAAIVLVSRGEHGAYFRCAAGAGELATYNVKTVDTTGAGDAFLGAVHYKLRGKSREYLQTISLEELRTIVDFANAAGSLTTTKRGAIPALPSMKEIENCMQK